ncbi:MAG: carboxymuconolactone decarboxylase family protein [Candidatus Tectomicrobia bacterium]|nr:carboxymuconolactone decarboxylase family protein [Candidatus Tectomicrobia bacterium]
MATDLLQEFQKDTMGVNHRGYELVSKFDPEYFKALKGFYADATFAREDAALSRKIKELIMVAVTTAKGSARGTRVHIKRALLCGATPKEVLEAIETATIPSGLPTLWAGIEALADELEAMGKEFS